MSFRNAMLIAIAVSALSAPAFAQESGAGTNNAADVQRDVNQQQRIEQGLQSGQLTTKEAGQLERQQQHVDKMEQNADRNGSISPAEQSRINAAQNKASASIYADKHNGVTGNSESKSSERMQADVQRNVNQQQRIENGVQSGSLTNHEVGSLERGQAHVNRTEANAAADGHVGAHEQARIQGKENFQSGRVYNKKHNGRVRQ